MGIKSYEIYINSKIHIFKSPLSACKMENTKYEKIKDSIKIKFKVAK